MAENMSVTEQIQSFVQTLIKNYKVPGACITVVYQDEVLMCQGFGVTDHSSQTHVTERTKFCIGSITKGFSAVLLASLLPEYSVDWNTPLKKIFNSQDFQFEEAFMTEKASLRDLLGHKMGIELGESDFGWLCASFERQRIASKVKYLPVTRHGFRNAMIYNNYMYALAGLVAEKLTGAKWEELIRGRFFQLLGMEDSGFIDEEDINSADLAKPHMSIKGVPTQISLQLHRGSECIGPAGSICSSARDMAMWIQFLLNEGQIGDLPIIKKALFNECWKPQFALTCGKPEWDGYVQQPQFPVTETRDTYCFGFYRGTYRGFKMLAHSGELLGYDSLLTLYPDLKLGIYTSFNGPGGENAYIGNQLIHYYVTDCILGLDKWLTPDHIARFPEPWVPREKYFYRRVQTTVLMGANPTRPMLEYVGTYKHGFLGEISINVDTANCVLNMYLGKIGQFHLHPNGELDEFRIEGIGPLSFLHQADLYAPSDWMMVRFCSMESSAVDSCIVSLFESGPVFKKVNVTPT